MFKYVPNNMGINMDSPTVQNIMQQNMQPQMQYYSAPNIGNIGGQGYNSGVNPYLDYMNSPNYNQYMNGGYYSGYYGYNPQEIMRQMEEQRRAQEEAIKNQINIEIMKAKIFNTFYGLETDEEYLEKLYDPNSYVEINKDLEEYEEMRRISEISNSPTSQSDYINRMAIENINRISYNIRTAHPVDQSFEDYLNTAGDLYRQALINDSIRDMKKNIGNTYDRNAYNQLATMHNQSSFASLRQATTVDDLSISLPPHLQRSSEYQQRKNAFLNYITQNDIRNRGGV